MAVTTPTEIVIDNLAYTRIVNNATEYLIQNVGSAIIYIVASDEDLGSSTTDDIGGYKIESLKAVDNTQLKNYPYVYAKSTKSTGVVRV